VTYYNGSVLTTAAPVNKIIVLCPHVCRFRYFHRYALDTSRDSSVGIATGYGLDDQGGGSLSPGRVKSSLLHIVQTDSGVHPTSYKMDTGG
jgi:hypothetical protein